jgi:hypothetical protein
MSIDNEGDIQIAVLYGVRKAMAAMQITIKAE